MDEMDLSEEEQSIVNMLMSNNLNDYKLSQDILGENYLTPERKKIVLDYVQSKMRLF